MLSPHCNLFPPLSQGRSQSTIRSIFAFSCSGELTAVSHTDPRASCLSGVFSAFREPEPRGQTPSAPRRSPTGGFERNGRGLGADFSWNLHFGAARNVGGGAAVCRGKARPRARPGRYRKQAGNGERQERRSRPGSCSCRGFLRELAASGRGTPFPPAAFRLNVLGCLQI